MQCFSGTCLVMAERVCRARTEKAVNVNKIRLIYLCELCVCGAKGKWSGGNKVSSRLLTECELAMGAVWGQYFVCALDSLTRHHRVSFGI